MASYLHTVTFEKVERSYLSSGLCLFWHFLIGAEPHTLIFASSKINGVFQVVLDGELISEVYDKDTIHHSFAFKIGRFNALIANSVPRPDRYVLYVEGVPLRLHHGWVENTSIETNTVTIDTDIFDSGATLATSGNVQCRSSAAPLQAIELSATNSRSENRADSRRKINRVYEYKRSAISDSKKRPFLEAGPLRSSENDLPELSFLTKDQDAEQRPAARSEASQGIDGHSAEHAATVEAGEANFKLPTASIRDSLRTCDSLRGPEPLQIDSNCYNSLIEPEIQTLAFGGGRYPQEPIESADLLQNQHEELADSPFEAGSLPRLFDSGRLIPEQLRRIHESIISESIIKDIYH